MAIIFIRVRDTGVGIPAKEVVRLFDPFFRVGTGVQRNFRGLVWVWRFVKTDQHDGRRHPGRFRTGNGQPVYRAYSVIRRSVPAEKKVEGLSGKRCWLAVRNASLWSVPSKPVCSAAGIVVTTYEGQEPTPEDVLITDEVVNKKWQGRAVVTFCRRHIGIPLEKAP